MNRTSIEWCRTYATDGTYEEGFSVNPVRFRPHGSERLVTMCQKVSPGCAHCYAGSIVNRFWPKDSAQPFPGYTAAGLLAGTFELDRAHLLPVLGRRLSARVFWGDMTDLFGEWVPDSFLDQCMAACALTPHLTHIFLTKRAQRQLEYQNDPDTPKRIVTILQRWMRDGVIFKNRAYVRAELYTAQAIQRVDRWPLPNNWHGVSTENQDQVDARVPLLRQTRATLHFASAEPLIGPINFTRHFWPTCWHWDSSYRSPEEARAAGAYAERKPQGLVLASSNFLRWIIVGGESGPNARPMHPDWPLAIRDQALAAGVPLFFKQWGRWMHGSDFRDSARIVLNDGRVIAHPDELTQEERNRFPEFQGEMMAPVGKKLAGHLLDGKQYHQFPEVRACLS